MKAGDRVKHKYLGKGTFIKRIPACFGLVLVKWDKTPSARYNMGEKLCSIFPDELTNIKE